jgi:hypothetical protein
VALSQGLTWLEVLVLGSRTTKRRTTQIDSKLAAPPTTAFQP